MGDTFDLSADDLSADPLPWNDTPEAVAEGGVGGRVWTRLAAHADVLSRVRVGLTGFALLGSVAMCALLVLGVGATPPTAALGAPSSRTTGETVPWPAASVTPTPSAPTPTRTPDTISEPTSAQAAWIAGGSATSSPSVSSGSQCPTTGTITADCRTTGLPGGTGSTGQSSGGSTSRGSSSGGSTSGASSGGSSSDGQSSGGGATGGGSTGGQSSGGATGGGSTSGGTSGSGGPIGGGSSAPCPGQPAHSHGAAQGIADFYADGTGTCPHPGQGKQQGPGGHGHGNHGHGNHDALDTKGKA